MTYNNKRLLLVEICLDFNALANCSSSKPCEFQIKVLHSPTARVASLFEKPITITNHDISLAWQV